ncbi:hypothetical protein M5K25_011250 [Dendrobium thyrsiflorum]|uniref:DNA-directed RNA polymerase C-terminal domain-containing protein n=1 Tax=Dendrobium thyrsiflorum TaxID=117978 RepID=A0ABD0V1T5_DENTH
MSQLPLPQVGKVVEGAKSNGHEVPEKHAVACDSTGRNVVGNGVEQQQRLEGSNVGEGGGRKEVTLAAIELPSSVPIGDRAPVVGSDRNVLLASFQLSFPSLSFPPLPERGDFNIKDVLDSTYFFN